MSVVGPTHNGFWTGVYTRPLSLETREELARCNDPRRPPLDVQRVDSEWGTTGEHRWRIFSPATKSGELTEAEAQRVSCLLLPGKG